MNQNQPRTYGPWKIHDTTNIYRDPFVNLRVDKVTRPDGKPGQHVVVEIKPGVCAFALDDAGNIVLTKEFHYAVGRESLEGVSGGIDPGEDAMTTAKRELAEELGLEAKDWRFLTMVDPFTTIMTSPTKLFVATNLSTCPTKFEGTEIIESVRIPLAEAVAKVKAGEITHAPTCVGILLLASER